MQTFLPYPDFEKSAKALDDKRLGKQRIEVVQILNALTGVSKSWQAHPAILMWKGYEIALTSYGYAICREWIARGFEDNCMKVLESTIDSWLMSNPKPIAANEFPTWFGDERLHSNHRARLMEKATSAYDAAVIYLDHMKRIKYKKFIRKAEKEMKHAHEVYKWYCDQKWKERPVTENFWPVPGNLERYYQP